LGRPAGPAYPPGLIAALDRGQMIIAVTAYRRWTGCGLAESKQAVEAIVRSRR
jgi:ribosomal protein L7/L12